MLEYINNNNKISYQSYGGGEKTILLIHDIGGSSSDFEQLIMGIQTRARIITIDLCGHGSSYIPRRTVSIKTMAREVVALIKDCYLGRPDVVALGSGGAIALEAYDLAPEIFKSFVFFDTFVSKKSRDFFGETIRPTGRSDKDVLFRDTFKRWVSAYRDDFFIFASEFDGRRIFRVSSSRMMFVYGDRNKGINISKDDMDLPSYSNIYMYIVRSDDRWILENTYELSRGIVERFLIDGSNDIDLVASDNDDEPDSPVIDINNLMYF